MRLPEMIYADGIVQAKLTRFGGLEHRRGAGDGTLWDMRNMGSDEWPLLSTMRPRIAYSADRGGPGGGILSTGHGILELFITDANLYPTVVYLNGTQIDALEGRQDRSMAMLGDLAVIAPDMVCYDVTDGTKHMIQEGVALGRVFIGNGTIYGEAAEANTIYTMTPVPFRVGDGITLNGCATVPENNKTVIIREIGTAELNGQTWNTIVCSENAFTLPANVTEYAEDNVGAIREAPSLRYICATGNRLWGCDDTTIYASKLGDPYNWEVFDLLDTDAWQWEAGSPGPFTGCIAYQGYPTFFKEDRIYKVYGSVPSAFQVFESDQVAGVADGSGRSLAIAGGVLYYLSTAGVMAYAGGQPQTVHDAFGILQLTEGIGGSASLKYYLSASDGANRRTYVYDTRYREWHIEETETMTGMCHEAGVDYMQINTGDDTSGICSVNGTGVFEGAWYAEFGDFTEDDPNKKGVGKILLRVELDEDATCRVQIMFDTSGEWIDAGEAIATETKRSYTLAIVPRRCDHYRLKLSGTGGCRVYSITREYYKGSSLKSTAGRQ